MARCFGDGQPDYERYHDEEWGRPVLTEAGLFERLCLEGFQAGLSWLTILRRREGFRAAFAGFDPDAVASFGERDVERLLGDAGIIRHRGKIEATIANAKVALALRDAGSPLDEIVLGYSQPPTGAPRALADVPAATPASIALSREFRSHGWRFLGPTTAYAAMQACGLVNDHLASCPVRAAVEREREAAGLTPA